MKIYTVHEPNPRKGEVTANPDRIRFIRDGFYFWAFLLGPVWMLWHRLWLVFVIYLAGTAAIQWGLFALGVSAAVKFAVGFLIAILIGCSAISLQRIAIAAAATREVPASKRLRRLGVRSLDCAEVVSIWFPVSTDMFTLPLRTKTC